VQEFNDDGWIEWGCGMRAKFLHDRIDKKKAEKLFNARVDSLFRVLKKKLNNAFLKALEGSEIKGGDSNGKSERPPVAGVSEKSPGGGENSE